MRDLSLNGLYYSLACSVFTHRDKFCQFLHPYCWLFHQDVAFIVRLTDLFFVHFFFLSFLICCLQFASLELVISTVMDCVGPMLPPFLRRKEVLVLLVCLGGFLVGLPCVFQVPPYTNIHTALQYITPPYKYIPTCPLRERGICFGKIQKYTSYRFNST